MVVQKKAAEKKESEKAKAAIVQVDDLLTFRQFSKKAAEDIVDVGQIFKRLVEVDVDVMGSGSRRSVARDGRWRRYGRLHLEPQSHLATYG